MVYILLLVGFVCLVKGADIFVEGSSSIAEHFRIPSFIVGLTIVALGTSAPEAAVSISAAVNGQNGIVAGNILGSNIFNLLAVLGVCSLIKPCPVETPILKKEYPMSILAALLFAALALTTIGGSQTMHFSRIDGLILLAGFVYFMASTFKKAFADSQGDANTAHKEISLGKSIVMAIAGIIGIILGGQLVVNNASAIAESFGISQTLIGLTIVAVGTSLPEMVTSVAAAVKGHTDIAVGNVIGSNLFNILFVMGISTTIHPVSVEMINVYDALIVAGITVVTMIPCLSIKHIDRKWGVLLLIMYAGYMAYAIMR